MHGTSPKRVKRRGRKKCLKMVQSSSSAEVIDQVSQTNPNHIPFKLTNIHYVIQFSKKTLVSI